VLFKRCFSCNKFSYSSSDEKTWICPYCGEDITGETASPAGRVKDEAYEETEDIDAEEPEEETEEDMEAWDYPEETGEPEEEELEEW